MKTTITNLDGESAGEIELPSIFETPYRPDLIQRAVEVAAANAAQPYGTDPFAGKRTSAVSIGTGHGRARVPRSNNRGRRVPQARGGRRAHPPKPETERGKSMNEQERQLATQSAVAATADASLVTERGHVVGSRDTFPIVVSDEFVELTKTREVASLLDELDLSGDIERAEEGRSIRAGRGKTRGRKYRQPKSILFVTSSQQGQARGARHLSGADVGMASQIDVNDLAPGGHAGRLTVWTEAAIEEVGSR